MPSQLYGYIRARARNISVTNVAHLQALYKVARRVSVTKSHHVVHLQAMYKVARRVSVAKSHHVVHLQVLYKVFKK